MSGLRPTINLEESLREAACKGDEVTVRNLVNLSGVNVNSAHSINKW